MQIYEKKKKTTQAESKQQQTPDLSSLREASEYVLKILTFFIFHSQLNFEFRRDQITFSASESHERRIK